MPRTSIYSFSGFRLEAAERLLYDGDRPITLPPKVFDTLRMVVENAGHVVEDLVKDLVAGSGLQFEEYGQHSFSGVEGDWRIFSVVERS